MRIETYWEAVARYYASPTRPYREFTYPQDAYPGFTPASVLEDGCRSLLLGQAGTGKTTFLDWTMAHAAKQKKLVPVFASLRNYTSTLDDLLRVSIERFVGQSEDSLWSLLSPDGINPALLFDGMDEVPKSAISKLSEEIHQVAAEFPQAPIVVTSRFEPIELEWGNWDRLAIPELTPDQIAEKLKDSPNGETLLRSLFASDYLLDLARKPTFLHTIRNAWSHGDDFRSILEREMPRYTAWRGHTKSLLPPSVLPSEIESLFGAIALELSVNDQSGIDTHRLTELASQVRQDDLPVEELCNAVLATDVLAQKDKDSVSFGHLSYIHSYAARVIAARIRDGHVSDSQIGSVLDGRYASGIAGSLMTLLRDKDLRALQRESTSSAVHQLIALGSKEIPSRNAEEQIPHRSKSSEFEDAVVATRSLAESQDRQRRRILVITVHGFNTRGDWKSVLGFELTRQADGQHFIWHTWDYGTFILGILNPLARRKQVNKFHAFYNECLGKDKYDDICVVAHSFGAYIAAHALLRFPEVAFDRFLMLGSALPRSFDWQNTKERCGKILNIISESDAALKLALLCPGLGDAGRRGFSKQGMGMCEHREAGSGHSDLFGAEYMKSTWIPFIRDGTHPS